MGFFLHIPFPSPDVFEKLPWKKPILEALLEFDVIGFQGDRDRSNFVSCLERLLPEVAVERGSPHLRVGLGGRRSVVGTFPIGIDFEAFERDAQRPEIAAHAAEIRKRVSDDVLVLGVDRLDYTKGIPERLKSFRLLLRRFPEMRGHITLVQVVVPSREEIPNYKHLRREVELLVSQINGEFTEPGWVPVHYIHRNLGREELLAYYRAADIGLVTPLKDGMNLVAKEFCAAQIDERGRADRQRVRGRGTGVAQRGHHRQPQRFRRSGPGLVRRRPHDGRRKAQPHAAAAPDRERPQRASLDPFVPGGHSCTRSGKRGFGQRFLAGAQRSDCRIKLRITFWIRGPGGSKDARGGAVGLRYPAWPAVAILYERSQTAAHRGCRGRRLKISVERSVRKRILVEGTFPITKTSGLPSSDCAAFPEPP